MNEKTPKYISFSDYVIAERSKYFYFESLNDLVKSKSKMTLEQWLSDMYLDYTILYNLK